jgi:hypothetical protein
MYGHFCCTELVLQCGLSVEMMHGDAFALEPLLVLVFKVPIIRARNNSPLQDKQPPVPAG